jgi:hypothetical protein
MAVDTLGHLLALQVTAANAQARAQGEQLTAWVQEVMGDVVEVAFVDEGCTGLCCCRAAGSSSAVSRGRRAFGVWPGRRIDRLAPTARQSPGCADSSLLDPAHGVSTCS